MKKPVVIKQPDNPAEQVSTEVIATELVAISEAMKKLRAGRLSDRALILLIQDSASSYGRISQATIKAVLDAAEGLAKTYTRKP